LKKLVAFSALAIAIATPAAHADTYGPLTIGANSPLYVELHDFTDSFGNLEYIEVYVGLPKVHLTGDNGGVSASQTISFAYDLAPGWTAGLTQIENFIDDDASSVAAGEAEDWGVEMEQEVILCPSYQVSGCSQGTDGIQHQGPVSMPPLILNGVAGPGTGIYEYAAYARNASFASNDVPAFLMYLDPPAATPEPSTFLLISTGLVGAFGAVKRRTLRI
jgi:PEP-CTERM motif